MIAKRTSIEYPKARVQFADQDDYLKDEEEWDANEDEIYEANPEDVAGESLVARRLCLEPLTKENWKRHDIFKTQFNTTCHPQTDGQTKAVNQSLANMLRAQVTSFGI
jgi:hypothetical protein